MFFVVLFIFSALIRVNSWVNSPLFYNSDTGRDYLISNHIVAYNEFPLVGPPSSAFAGLNTNIIYYYILAAFLTIKNSLFFLGLANVFLQVLTIALVYVLAKRMFGLGTALVAGVLFAFSHAVLVQSYFPWQPHFVQFFAASSYLLLFLSYTRKSYPLMLLSIFLLLFSVAVHNSVLSLVPLFMIAAFFILRTQKRSIGHYILALATAAGSFFIMYIPTFIYLQTHNRELPSIIFRMDSYVMSAPLFFHNFLQNASSLIAEFLPHAGSDIFSLNIGLLLVLSLCVPVYFFYSQKDSSKKTYTLLIFLAILQPLLASAFLHTSQYHYFIAVYSLFIIFISEIIYTVFSKNILLKAAGAILFIMLLAVFSSNFYFIDTKQYLLRSVGTLNVAAISYATLDAVKVKRARFSREQQSMEETVAAMKKEIYKIQKVEGVSDFNFFQIRHYVKGTEDPVVDASFWIPLEKDFNKKLTKINDSIGFGYESINYDRYIILICNYYPVDDDKECTDNFLRQHPSHSLENKFYSTFPFLMYVARAE